MEAKAVVKDRKINQQELAATQDPEFIHDVITQETRKWGFSLLLVGVIQLLANSFLDPEWGITLILVGAASFYFRSAAMFPVYGVTLAWAMVGNLMSGQPRWMILALIQGFWAFRTFQQFILLRRATSCLGIKSSEGTDRAAVLFPWAGCALSAAAPVGFVALIFVLVLWSASTGQEPSQQALDLAGSAILDSAYLGFALGLAALLSRFRWRLVSLLAVLGGGLMLGFFTLVALLQ